MESEVRAADINREFFLVELKTKYIQLKEKQYYLKRYGTKYKFIKKYTKTQQKEKRR